MDNSWNSTAPGQPPGGDPSPEEEAGRDPAGAGGFTPVFQDPGVPARKHSLPGIISFALFAGMALLFIGLLIAFIARLGSALDLDNSTADDPDLIAERIRNMPELAFMALAMLATFAGNLAGLVLGIIGLVQRERKKVFPILGTVLNGLVLAVIAFLIFIGLVVASSGS